MGKDEKKDKKKGDKKDDKKGDKKKDDKKDKGKKDKKDKKKIKVKDGGKKKDWVKPKKDKKDKDKKKKKEPKQKKDKDEKKQWKKEKKDKKQKKMSQVAAETDCFVSGFDRELVNNIEVEEAKATSGASGAQAKTAAEEWANAGKVGGLQIWRIEQFKLVPWPREQYGTFYNGDSFIVLKTEQKGSSLRHDIHFWLGQSSTQDEVGTAAYKTVELDDQLGGFAAQHREVQDFESEAFLALFPPAINILTGGVDSGFNHVEEAMHRDRLLHLKGKRTIRVTEVSLTTDSLNSGDVFILDGGTTIHIWNGKESSVRERTKGGEIATSLRNERKGKSHVVTNEEGSEEDGFWALLGGRGDISPASEGGDDLEAEKDQVQTKVLLRLSDAAGTMQFTEVARGNISRSQLDSSDAFILDSGYEVFAWVGKQASKDERRQALGYAQQYLTSNNRPAYLPISRVIEGGENVSFEAVFK